jgi:hypothetical protein
LPPVSAQNREEIAVQFLTADADGEYLSSKCGVSALGTTPAVPLSEKTRRYTPQARGDVVCALGTLKADFGMRD